ncbi:MAG: hypothetical protein WCG40_03335 [Actinomycetes bacterium]
MKQRGHRDRGNVSILMIGVVALSLISGVALADADVHLSDSLGAQTVADAVALAVINFGARVAHDVAHRNNAVIETMHTADSGAVTVTVRLGDAVATASASDAP